MTYEFNVDRFYAQLGAFSFFVISYDRGIKLESNWNSWPMNLMLTDFTPNWALFLFFVISHDRHMEHGWNWILWPSILMLTDFTPNWALFSIFTISHISDPSQQNRAVVCYQEKCDIPFIWKNILLTQKWYHSCVNWMQHCNFMAKNNS